MRPYLPLRLQFAVIIFIKILRKRVPIQARCCCHDFRRVRIGRNCLHWHSHSLLRRRRWLFAHIHLVTIQIRVGTIRFCTSGGGFHFFWFLFRAVCLRSHFRLAGRRLEDILAGWVSRRCLGTVNRLVALVLNVGDVWGCCRLIDVLQIIQIADRSDRGDRWNAAYDRGQIPAVLRTEKRN